MVASFNLFELVTLRRTADGALVLVSGDPAVDDRLVVVVVIEPPAIALPAAA